MKVIVATALLLGSTAICAIAGPATTPEPGTIVLLGGGLAALGLTAWRRNRRK